MATEVDIREQRLRKQAELQSLNISLANLREREVSYITAQAAIPEILTSQIIEIRQKIETLEDELFALKDDSRATAARRFYHEAFEAEVEQDFEKAIKLLKNAARHTHPDANAALRSLRYRLKKTKARTTAANIPWSSGSFNRPMRFSLGLVIALLIVVLIAILVLNSFLSNSPETLALDATATLLSMPSLTPIIFPNTATPTRAQTPTVTPSATSTNTPVPPVVPPPEVALEPTLTPTAVPTLRPAPKIVGPQNGLVWKDGAIVFEFDDMNLADNELYCLDTLKGYDKSFTENWSYPPTGNKAPRIPIDANVFRIAELQDMRCIVWSAYIGQGSCDNVVSESSEPRVIGLPVPCDLR